MLNIESSSDSHPNFPQHLVPQATDPAVADRQDAVTAIQEGLADIAAGRTKSARSALRALASKYGIALPAN